MADPTHWEMTVKITWLVRPDDVAKKFEGDAEVDFASRGVARVKPALQAMVDEIGGGGFIIMTAEGNQLARRCYD